MKKQTGFIGLLLIGFGIYFVLEQFTFLSDAFFRWPSYLLIIGIALWGQVFKGKDYGLLFPASFISLLALHFHLVYFIDKWPSHWSMIPFIIAISFLLLFQKTKSGLLPCVLFLIVAIIGFLYPNGSGATDPFLYYINRYWSTLLIVVGLYYLFRRYK